MSTGTPIEPYTIEPVDPQPYDQGVQTTTYDFDTTETTSRRSIPWPLIGIGALLIIGFIALGLLLFSGGGSSDSNNGTSNPPNSPTRNASLQFWGAYIPEAAMQPLLDEYMELNENITIEYADRMREGNFESAHDGYRSDLFRVLNGDTVDIPDIFMVHNSWAHDFENVVQPSLIYDYATFTDTFVDPAEVDFTNNQIVYGAPMWIDTLNVIYNETLLNAAQLNEPPDNWARFVTAAEELTEFEGNTLVQGGFAAGNAVNVSFFFELLQVLLWQNGVDLPVTQDAGLNIASSDAVDAVNFYQQFITSPATWSSGLKNDSAAFLEESAAMIVAPSWRYREIVRINDVNNVGIPIGTKGLPQIEGQERINVADYWGVMVSNSRPYALESWQFIAWLLEPEQQEKLHENIEQEAGYFGHIYPRKDMLDRLDNNEYLADFVVEVPFAQSWFRSKGIEIRELFRDFLTGSQVSASRLASLEEDIEALRIFKGTLRTLE